MSASCQLVNSMFEVRPIGTRTKFKPVKKPEADIPSVELVAELVEVELEELRFYVMVSVQYAPFGIADGNVHPGQDFPDTLFVVRNDSQVRGCHPVLLKGGIAAEPVRGHIGTPVRTLLNLTRDGGSLEIIDDLHLYMPDTLWRTVFLDRRRLWQAAFRHDKDRGLALASPSAFQRAIFPFFGRFRGEEALVNLKKEKAYQNLQELLAEATLDNLLDNHPPFQIDGNFGGACGILEMIVQDYQDVVYLLPALPQEMPDGNVSGIRTKSGFILNMEWSGCRVKSVEVESVHGTQITIVNETLESRKIRCEKGEKKVIVFE